MKKRRTSLPSHSNWRPTRSQSWRGAEGILASGTGGVTSRENAASGIGGTVSGKNVVPHTGDAALGSLGVTPGSHRTVTTERGPQPSNLRVGLMEGQDRPVLKVMAAAETYLSLNMQTVENL